MASGPMTTRTSIAIGFKPKIVFISAIYSPSSFVQDYGSTVILIKPEDSDTITLQGDRQTTQIMFSDTGITVKGGYLSSTNTEERHTSWFAIG